MSGIAFSVAEKTLNPLSPGSGGIAARKGTRQHFRRHKHEYNVNLFVCVWNTTDPPELVGTRTTRRIKLFQESFSQQAKPEANKSPAINLNRTELPEIFKIFLKFTVSQQPHRWKKSRNIQATVKLESSTFGDC